jgi:DNA-binding cell septation regulator SpoVG
MKVTNVKLHKTQGKTTLKAFAQVVLDGQLKLTGLKLFESEIGLYLAYPRNPKSKTSLCFAFPMDESFRNEIENEVIEVYENN